MNMQTTSKYPLPKFTKAQQAWCVEYEQWTGFEPLTGDYEAGHETFVEAAKKSVVWYEGHTQDMHLRISSMKIPGQRI